MTVRFAFDEFVLDTGLRELRRSGEAVPAGPQVFDLLVHLVRNRDRVVTKDDMVETVWRGRIVSDSTLTSCINAARKALGDSGEAQRFIRTVPRKGIRFVGEVRDQQPAPAVSVAAPTTERRAIAVLPFTNMSGDASEEYFVDGISEDIISALAKWRSFPVIARNSTFTYRGQNIDVRQIGRELNARYVLEGSVRRAAGRVRITAQLVDAMSGEHIWADRYDRDLTDIFAIQDEISRHIAATVEPELGKYEQHRSAARAPVSLEAWDLVHRGLYLLYRLTKADIAAAREFLERAVELDPRSSRARSTLAYSHQLDILYGFSADRAHSIAALLSNARQAVTLDDADSYARIMLGFGYRWAGDLDLAIAESRRAVELNPSDAWALATVGNALDLGGEHAEAIDILQRAMTLNPRDTHVKFYLAGIARAHLAKRDHEGAVAWARKSIERDPAQPRPHLLLASALGHLGRHAEAGAALENCRRAQPDFVNAWLTWREYRDQAVNDHIADGLRKAGLD